MTNRDMTAYCEIQSALDEALCVQINLVDRPHPNGTSEPWLDVTYCGRRVGWLPADTDPQRALNQARRWLHQDRKIRKDAMKNPVPSAAGAVIGAIT